MRKLKKKNTPRKARERVLQGVIIPLSGAFLELLPIATTALAFPKHAWALFEPKSGGAAGYENRRAGLPSAVVPLPLRPLAQTEPGFSENRTASRDELIQSLIFLS